MHCASITLRNCYKSGPLQLCNDCFAVVHASFGLEGLRLKLKLQTKQPCVMLSRYDSNMHCASITQLLIRSFAAASLGVPASSGLEGLTAEAGTANTAAAAVYSCTNMAPQEHGLHALH